MLSVFLRGRKGKKTKRQICGVRQEQNNKINGGELNRKQQKNKIVGQKEMQAYVYNNRTVKQKYCTINGQPTKRQQKHGEKKRNN